LKENGLEQGRKTERPAPEITVVAEG
jgi:hypothetical protein